MTRREYFCVNYSFMDINWTVIIIAALVVVVIIILFLRRNRKDEQQFERQQNQDYPKPKDTDEISGGEVKS